MLKKCFQCNKITYTPFHVTEIAKDKTFYAYDLCKLCGEDLMNIPQKTDLTHITTPEQLLNFISGSVLAGQKDKTLPCNGCGLTIDEFNVNGRFGCAACYTHFTEKMEKLVFPCHAANCHVGKFPKKQLEVFWNSTPEEKIKLLKIRLAKAVELEEYEKAAEIKVELEDVLSKIQPSSFVDQ